MTPEEERNLEAARRWTLLYNADPERWYEEMLADDLQYHAPGRGIHRTTGGREPMRTAMRAILSGVPDRKQRVIAMAVSGDTVFIEHFWEGTSSGELERFGPRGTPVSLQGVSVLRFEDGRVASETVYA